jgi:hypothetical protein
MLAHHRRRRRHPAPATSVSCPRYSAVHELRDAGVGLCECARQLGLSLNTVKRYARVSDPDQLVRPPQYRRCLVDPFRDHLRERRAAGPVATTTLLAEIRAMGYTGGANLLDRYLKQGRPSSHWPTLRLRRLTGWILTDPAHLTDPDRVLRDKLTTACPQLTALAGHVATFARLLTEPGGSLQDWADAVTADDLPALHSLSTAWTRTGKPSRPA